MKDYEKYAESIYNLYSVIPFKGVDKSIEKEVKELCAIIHIQGQIDEMEWLRWVHGVSEYAEGRVVFLQKAIEYLKT